MAKEPTIVISGASVKVMRSYDYCHFEVSLSTAKDEPLNTQEVDELRKEAMRLADKAVKQYKIARHIESDQVNIAYKRRRLVEKATEAEKTPEDQRTPEQKAALKTLEDYNFHMSLEYDYEDDWDSEDWEARQNALES